MSHQAKIALVVVLAILAALALSFGVFLYKTLPRTESGVGTSTIQQDLTAADKVRLLEQMVPTPASDATVAKHSKALNAVSKSSAQSAAMNTQSKLDALAQMQGK